MRKQSYICGFGVGADRRALVYLLAAAVFALTHGGSAGPLPGTAVAGAVPAPQMGREEDGAVIWEQADGVRYATLAPGDAGHVAGVVIAFPPGPQDRPMVERTLHGYWGGVAALGWRVLCPYVVEGEPRFDRQDAEALWPWIQRFHQEVRKLSGEVPLVLAGPSNGGRSAFHLAAAHPDRLDGLLGLPGFPSDATLRSADFANLPVYLFGGSEDPAWAKPMQDFRDALQRVGGEVTLTLYPGEGHVPPSLDGAVIAEAMQAIGERWRRRQQLKVAVGTLLDDFHSAASKADGRAYFAMFAGDAVFLGTDPGERWSLAEFRRFAQPYFDRGQGWTYRPTARRLQLDRDGNIAWFDETLSNDKYGEVRGSGVLSLYGDRWLLRQYNLTFTVPNELSGQLVELIRARSEEGGK